MKTEKGAWLMWFRHVNAEVIETNDTEPRVIVRSREEWVSMYSNLTGTKRHYFPVDALHSIRKSWPREQVNEKKDIVKVEILHRFYRLFRTVSSFASAQDAWTVKCKSKEKKTTLRKTLLTSSLQS